MVLDPLFITMSSVTTSSVDSVDTISYFAEPIFRGCFLFDLALPWWRISDEMEGDDTDWIKGLEYSESVTAVLLKIHTSVQVKVTWFDRYSVLWDSTDDEFTEKKMPRPTCQHHKMNMSNVELRECECEREYWKQWRRVQTLHPRISRGVLESMKSLTEQYKVLNRYEFNSERILFEQHKISKKHLLWTCSTPDVVAVSWELLEVAYNIIVAIVLHKHTLGAITMSQISHIINTFNHSSIQIIVWRCGRSPGIDEWSKSAAINDVWSFSPFNWSPSPWYSPAAETITCSTEPFSAHCPVNPYGRPLESPNMAWIQNDNTPLRAAKYLCIGSPIHFHCRFSGEHIFHFEIINKYQRVDYQSASSSPLCPESALFVQYSNRLQLVVCFQISHFFARFLCESPRIPVLWNSERNERKTMICCCCCCWSNVGVKPKGFRSAVIAA